MSVLLRADQLDVLCRFGYDESHVIGTGTQAIVIDTAHSYLIKIYKQHPNLPDFHQLKSFYDSIHESDVFETPLIDTILVRENFVLVRELKLGGTSFTSEKINALAPAELSTYVDQYVNTLFAIRELHSSTLQPLTLFMHNNQFLLEGMSDWNQLMSESITAKCTELRSQFARDITQFESKIERILSFFSTPFAGTYDIIHGDFAPVNVLHDDALHATGVIDFGTLTTKGDYFFDLASGWSFVDMYDEITSANVKNLVLEQILRRLGPAASQRLAYTLFAYNIISANMYSPTCDDRHYGWSIASLNNDEYWQMV